MFKRGNIVWGKLKSYPWWPAIVLNPKDCGRDKVEKNKLWLFWFGDHRITQVECSKVLDFQKHFKEKCVTKMRKALKSAIQEVLIILAADYSIKFSDPSSLFEWANKNFKRKLRLSSDDSKSLELPDIVINALQKEVFKPKSTSEDEEDEIVKVLAGVSKGNISLEDICVMCCKSGISIAVPHPFFIGGVCQSCRLFITKIMKSPKGQMNSICILCGQGGKLIYCCNNLCMSAFCETCIDYMAPKETISEILKDNDWKCYLCVPNPDADCLIKKREVYLTVGPPSRPVEKSICVMGLNKAVQTILKKKMISIDDSSFLLPRSKQNYHDFSCNEIKDIDPDFIYGSFFVSPITMDRKESLELFYASFYQFLLRLQVTRPWKADVFFMYMCEAEVIDPFHEKRVRRFLQVDTTIIHLPMKSVSLWSNLPAIKGIQGNVYSMKKTRGLAFIEEDILNKFLEPFKDFFMKEY